MAVWGRQQRKGVFARSTCQHYSAGTGAEAQFPVIRRTVYQLTHNVFAVVVELPDTGIQRNTSAGGTGSTPSATAPRPNAPTKVKVVNVSANGDLVCANHRPATVA